MTGVGTDRIQFGDSLEYGAYQCNNGWVVQPIPRIYFDLVKRVLEDRNQG